MLNRGELEARFDPEYFLHKKKVSSFAFPAVPFKRLLKTSPQYGANETGVEREDKRQPRYIRITDIDEFGQLIENDLGKTAATIETKYILQNNDLLFARSGNTVGKAYLHKTANVDYECFFAGYMIRFVVNENLALPDYIFSFTQTRIYQDWVKGIRRAAGQPNINAEEYKSLLIPVPPLETQEQIVSLMNQAYAEKAAKEREARELLASVDAFVLEKLGIRLPDAADNSLRRCTFYADFKQLSGGRFDPNFSRPFYQRLVEIIEQVPHKPLKHLARFASEIWNQQDYFDETFSYIEISGVDTLTGEIIEISEIEKAEAPSRARMIVRSGDILVSTTRPNRGAITL